MSRSDPGEVPRIRAPLNHVHGDGDVVVMRLALALPAEGRVASIGIELSNAEAVDLGRRLIREATAGD